MVAQALLAAAAAVERLEWGVLGVCLARIRQVSCHLDVACLHLNMVFGGSFKLRTAARRPGLSTFSCPALGTARRPRTALTLGEPLWPAFASPHTFYVAVDRLCHSLRASSLRFRAVRSSSSLAPLLRAARSPKPCLACF